MRRIYKLTLGISVGLLFVLAVLFVSAPMVVNSPGVQQWLIRQINTAINGDLSWQTLQVSLFAGKVSAEQVRLTDREGKQIAGVAHLEAGISWPLLLQGVLQLEPVILEKPQVTLEIRSDGKVNIAHAFESPHAAPAGPDEDSSTLTVILRSVKLSQGQLNLKMPDYGMNISARGLGLSGAADFSGPSATAQLSAEHLHYQGQGIDRDLSDLQLRASLDGQKLTLQAFSLSSAFSSLKISGSLDGLFDIPRFDISAQLKTQLIEIGQIFNVEPQPTGPVALSLNLDGSFDNPRATLRMRYDGGELWGRNIAAAALRLDLDALNLSFDGSATDRSSGKITFQGAVDLGPAFAGRGLTSDLNTDRIAYRYDIKAADLDLSGLLPQLPDLAGRLTAAIEGAGTGLLPQDMDGGLGLKAELKQLKDKALTAPVDMRLSGRVAVKKGFLNVSELSFRAGGTRINGRAGIDMGRLEGEASIDVAAADLARDLSLLGIKGISGSLNGRIAAAGSLEKPQFEVSLRGSRLAAAAANIGDLKVKAQMGPEGILQVSTLTIENGQSRISASGRLPLYDMISGEEMRSDLQLTATLEHLALRDFLTDVPLSGIFNGRLSAGGRLPKLTARATITGRGLESADVRVGDLDADLRLQGADVFLDRLRIHSRESEIQASGRVRLLEEKRFTRAKDPAFELRVAGKDLNIGDFTDTIGGQVSLDADLKGTLLHPDGTVRMAAANIETAVQKIAELKLLARVAEDVLQVENFSVSPVPGQQIAGRGQITRDGDYVMELAASGLSLDAIDWVRQRQVARGDIALTVSGRGSLKNPRLQADINISSLRINQKPFEDAVLHLDLRDSKAHLKGYLTFDVEADYDLKSRHLAMSAVFDQTDLGPYLRLADMANWTGSLTGKFSARGQPDALDAMEAALELDDVGFFYHDRQVVGGRQLSVVYRQGRIDFRDVNLSLLEQGQLTVQGQAVLNGPLGVRLEANLPLQALQVFSEELGNPQGQLKLHGDVGGVFDAPAMKGTIDFEGIGLIVPGLDQRLHDLNGRIEFTPRRIEIRKIEGMLDSGRLLLTGGADIQGLNPTAVSLKIETRGLAIEPMEDVEAVLDADLSLTGNAEKSLLAGKVELIEGYYERDINLNLLKIAKQGLTSLGEKQRAFKAPAKKFGQIDVPFVKNMQFDVDFFTRQPFVVDNNLAYMEISADTKLKGSVSRPSVVGRASVDSGAITFQGQAFEITRGVIDFVNPYRIEPNLDITSEGQVGNYRIFLSLQGSVEELDLKLTSDPPLPEADILSLILLGRTTAQLSDRGGGFGGEDIAAGLLSSGLGSSVKKKTGLDTLQAETQPTDEDTEDAASAVRITVGKNLNKRLSVKYQYTTGGDENIQRTVAEYKLLENLLISGYQENTGTYGGLLKYRLEFR